MAAVTRQPFAPLDGARLQNLTSHKNRQNAIPINSPVKRKAEAIDTDDSENVDPTLFSKRSKAKAGLDSDFGKEFFKPSAFVLTKASSTAPASPAAFSLPTKAASLLAPAPRAFLQPKSPAAKLNTSLAIKSSPLSAPAGRSPTRGSKRIGILSNRRRTAGSFGRVDPPSFGLGSAAPFSLDAALKGTIPGYTGSSPKSATSKLSSPEPEMKSSWFFDIHEDTPEQEMTNLLQHSTCTLDISSDEESELKARRDRAEGRDKENVPPADDVSQTTAAAAARRMPAEDDMIVEKSRGPLAEMNAADYYAAGCDSASVVVVPGDDGEDIPEQANEVIQPEPAPSSIEFAPEIKLPDVRALMGEQEPASKAAALEPMDGTGESFELWESGSAKDDHEIAPALSMPDVAEPVEA